MQLHAKHAEILEAVAWCCPGGEVRVRYTPLRRPCDYAVTIDGRYTVAAPALAAWAEVEGLERTGFDFSAAYERIFDRNWTTVAVEYMQEKDNRRAALLQRQADNAKLDAIVSWICR